MNRSSKPLNLELSRTAEKALAGLTEKDLNTIKGLLRIIARDPFDPAYKVKLRGEWEGCRRARKGSWRVIYYPPEGNTVRIVYIRSRDDRTYHR